MKMMNENKIDKDFSCIFQKFVLIRFIERSQGHRDSVMHEFSSSVDKAYKAITKVRTIGKTTLNKDFCKRCTRFFGSKMSLATPWYVESFIQKITQIVRTVYNAGLCMLCSIFYSANNPVYKYSCLLLRLSHEDSIVKCRFLRSTDY